MHLLARVVPERESRNEMRAILCVQCGHDILTANGLPNDDAREPIANHYNTSEQTHDVVGKLAPPDIAFVSAKAHGFETQYPDSLLAVRREA